MLPTPGQESKVREGGEAGKGPSDTLNLGRWVVGHEFVADYLRAVEDRSSIYRELDVAPPMALAARALGALLKELSLPRGTIHASQELDCKRMVKLGEEVSCLARLTRPMRRGDWQITSAEFALSGVRGEALLIGKSTVLVPMDGVRGETKQSSPVMRQALSLEGLPILEKVITQEQLARYASVSGDHNPLHLDAEFASTTQFRGIIAHGMLTLAFISEMLTLAVGQGWLESGKLKVRFKAPAYLGDRVRTWGEVTRIESVRGGRDGERAGQYEEPGVRHTSVEYSVGLSNSRGEELISGVARCGKEGDGT